jgi:ribosomal protein S7
MPPETKHLPVKDLVIDLGNYRTLYQNSEVDAVIAMIAVRPDPFWALMESLLDDGYHPTENILVLKDLSQGQPNFGVKEGNRRIGALKLAFGYIKSNRIDIPEDLEAKIKKITPDWKKANLTVPCTIYESADAEVVDKIVNLTHGKSQLAGRDVWRAVGRARHNRDKNGASEPALDVLEKFLRNTSDLSPSQVISWGGDYPITVLDEALKNLAPRCSFESAKAMADKYPEIDKFRKPLDKLVKQIGFRLLGFGDVRDESEDFAVPFGFPPKPPAKGEGGNGGGEGKGEGGKGKKSRRKTRATGLDDVRTVRRKLRSLSPSGKDREKVVTLIDELATLNLSTHPHAFCFVLRCVFEISAKAFCDEHKLKRTDDKGNDLSLAKVLKNVTNFLTKDSKDLAKTKDLHGAFGELKEGTGVLSVTSMNQLVHHKTFSVKDTHICAVFSNIFPLLEEMNH